MPNSPARIEVEVRGVGPLADALGRIVPFTEVETGTRVARVLEREARKVAKPHTVDTGEIARSIVTSVPQAGTVLARVYSNHQAIHAIEYGRRPGGRMPPTAPIADWARRHNIDAPAFVLARAIARKGTEPLRPFGRAVDALQSHLGTIRNAVETAVRNAFERRASG